MMLQRPTSTAAVSLDRLTAADEARTGAKAYNCGRLKQAGFHVPEGVVVLANATDADVAAVAGDPWFDQWPADVRFAVRSSGIGEDGDGQSFAGIHQTFLDVPRADLADAVSRCRASGQAAQALDYRRAKGMSTDRIEMGVLIQRMIHPVTAGVAFSVNPVTGATGELVINASWGLGEALVSGQVDPDEFVVRKADGELLWTRLGDKGGDGQHSASLTADSGPCHRPPPHRHRTSLRCAPGHRVVPRRHRPVGGAVAAHHRRPASRPTKRSGRARTSVKCCPMSRVRRCWQRSRTC